MIFNIKRISTWESDKQPHEKAFKEYCTQTVSLNFAERDEKWYQEGIDHRTVEGRAIREFAMGSWVIEINSLQELLDFQDECGHELIINENTLEICDDCRY